YAFLLGGLLDLYEADHDPAWIEWAGDLADSMLALFYDRGKGGFYMTAEGAGPELLYRVMEDSDGVEPSASSAAALALLRLAQLTDRTDLRDAAEKTMERFGAQLRDQPRSLMRMLQALDWGTQKPRQVVIAGNPEDPAALEMLRAVNGRFLPTQALIVLRDESDRARLSRRLGALRGMVPLKGKPAAYVCRNFACEMPVTDLAALQRSLQDAPTK
ncbi:MAG TPA: hypothetical protein VNI01_16585, partial [Elusimicrobiota bacterium]|nr:hypothetical protein [Elusimicrobiota bacterium]